MGRASITNSAFGLDTAPSLRRGGGAVLQVLSPAPKAGIISGMNPDPNEAYELIPTPPSLRGPPVGTRSISGDASRQMSVEVDSDASG
jgi:hypothetical protein